jgi:hypothetical protein
VEDSQSAEAGISDAEYVDGWTGSRPIESTAAAHYLFYAATPTGWNGRLIDVYA